MRLYLTLKFDQEIDPNKHYISPGGYEITCKDGKKIAFDFEDYEGSVSDEDHSVLYTTQKNLDIETFPDAAGLNEVLRSNNFEGFEEFFVYTGESDDPEINLKEILAVCFELNDFSKFELNKFQIQQVNSLINE